MVAVKELQEICLSARRALKRAAHRQVPDAPLQLFRTAAP
jgi:hypothetical protein